MRDTKNGKTLKSKSSKLAPAAAVREAERGMTAARYGYMALFSMLSSLAIWRGMHLESLLGAFFISLLLMVVFYRDMLRYKPRFISSGRRLVLLGLMLAGTLLLSRLSEFVLTGMSKGLGFPGGSIIYAIPVATGAMLVMLLFDSHTSIMFSFVVSLLAGLWLRDAAYTVYVFMGSLTAAFSVIRCKKRTEILKGGVYLLGINVVTVIFILLFRGELFTVKAGFSVLFAVVSAFGVIAAVSLSLPLLEYLFGITTDISLLELLDLEHPLMKTMMITAPGTYHHSIIVGNLVEAAAEDVGVNPLLARVSAYYHDIGKIKMPEYFIENQAGAASKHERLTPHMSSMVLISHVKEGVELAKQYKLPEAVIDIISQHHGNSLITYFYQKAKEKSEELAEDEYRYPGPSPQTKVAALVMMADAVEAASRVLSDPTSTRISALVNKIINHIFIEGQLDNCELTLKDIQAIKKRFIYILTGILHKRIDYPGFDFEREAGSAGADIQPPRPDTAKPQQDKERQPQAASFVWSHRS
ncbi:MAG: HDIG domain-containing protein [Nitrospiraceae bacterium]|nr:HDIG domain-containing protein [Nitrospiraceae bacterium]